MATPLPALPFGGRAHLQGSYRDSTWFEQCRFSERADFGPTFAKAYFSGSTFLDEASFWHTTFNGRAFFIGTVFDGQATFDEATFSHGLDARRSHFNADTSFDRTVLRARLDLERASFATFTHIDTADLDVEDLVLDRAVFAEDLSLAGSSRAAFARGTRFRGRTHLRLAGGTIELDGADFGGISLIAGRSAERVRVRSLKGANVREFVLSEVDLAACEFAEAQGLETLRIEGDASFAVLGGWDKRRAIAEEHAWRSRAPDALTPRRIAGIYRSLRKGLEERKNEPGAADFYYGEMEMRRHDRDTPSGERVLLWLYWALSGYALRASRAFLAFLAVVLLAAVAFAGFGFRETDSLGSALLYSLGTSVRVASAEKHELPWPATACTWHWASSDRSSSGSRCSRSAVASSADVQGQRPDVRDRRVEERRVVLVLETDPDVIAGRGGNEELVGLRAAASRARTSAGAPHGRRHRPCSAWSARDRRSRRRAVRTPRPASTFSRMELGERRQVAGVAAREARPRCSSPRRRTRSACAPARTPRRRGRRGRAAFASGRSPPAPCRSRRQLGAVTGERRGQHHVGDRLRRVTRDGRRRR